MHSRECTFCSFTGGISEQAGRDTAKCNLDLLTNLRHCYEFKDPEGLPKGAAEACLTDRVQAVCVRQPELFTRQTGRTGT